MQIWRGCEQASAIFEHLQLGARGHFMQEHAKRHCCAVGSASAKQLLTMCWSLAVLEQTESEMFQVPWRALLQKQQEDIGLDSHVASSYCQVCQCLNQSVICQLPSSQALSQASCKQHAYGRVPLFLQIVEELRQPGQQGILSGRGQALYNAYRKIWMAHLQTEKRLVSQPPGIWPCSSLTCDQIR